MTGIDAIEDRETETGNSMEPAVIYTLTGIRMPEGTKVSDLPKGIYIVNGKKVVK